jgi:hypothetical protein
LAQRELALRELAQRELAQRELAQRELAQRELAQRAPLAGADGLRVYTMLHDFLSPMMFYYAIFALCGVTS